MDDRRVIDFMMGADEIRDSKVRVEKFVDIVSKAHSNGNDIYCVACGTSFNAAKTAAVFFNHIAGINIFPMLPGDFRSQASNAVNNGDVVIGISQSGETKDLIDIINQTKESGKKTTNIVIVNNINSTLALEKSDLYLPLYCGSEIAVPATKSFINQLVVLYILAIGVAEKLGINATSFRENLRKIPSLIAATIETIKKSVDAVAEELFLEPSIHILATGMQGIAREGALKIREVVLNHTEGYEATEFKHGPNTILGVNTIFGLDAVRALLKKFSDIINDTLDSDHGKDIDSKSLHRLYNAVADYAFTDKKPNGLNSKEMNVFNDIFRDHNFFNTMYTNYPLIFTTGPSDRDVNLTISQINTHKIRGANIYVIAEENKLLHDACSKPVLNKYGANYRFGYIKLPHTGDNILPFFSSAVVLQLLALDMSIRKLTFLDKLEIDDHGVHPDSPKNVSKSVTVD
jgi:glucosamine 6-phosphate synthetase-like amidotransferase/phosphosugar isomerase protein